MLARSYAGTELNSDRRLVVSRVGLSHVFWHVGTKTTKLYQAKTLLSRSFLGYIRSKQLQSSIDSCCKKSVRMTGWLTRPVVPVGACSRLHGWPIRQAPISPLSLTSIILQSTSVPTWPPSLSQTGPLQSAC